jgi:hypothetical protein
VRALQPLKIACVFKPSYSCQRIAAKTLLLAACRRERNAR